MIRRSLGPWLVALSMQAVGSAHAQDATAQETALRPSYDACVKASRGVTLALNNCIGNEHDFQDKRLNAAYQNLRKSLSEVKRAALRDEERAWIAQRDRLCSPDASGGTGSLLDANQCQLDQTAARAVALEARMGQ